MPLSHETRRRRVTQVEAAVEREVAKWEPVARVASSGGEGSVDAFRKAMAAVADAS